MLSKKIFLSAALVSMAGFVACGDDSSSNSGDGKLPEKVPTLEKALKLPCDEALKCEKVFVEEENINDYFQCDGERWQPITDPKFTDLCSAKEEGSNSEGTEKGSNNDGNSSDSKGSSSDSEGSSSDSEGNSSDSEGNSSDSNDNSSDSAENNKPAEMVSCDNLTEEGQQAFGTMGEKCTEFEKGTMAASALELRCEDYNGTLGTGCPAEESKDNSNCIDKSQCDAMVKSDISTWHFTRADDFGQPRVYVYSVADNGTDLIINIDGDEKSYSMYNMSKEIGVEMAFSAAKSTCNSGMEIEGANYCE